MGSPYLAAVETPTTAAVWLYLKQLYGGHCTIPTITSLPTTLSRLQHHCSNHKPFTTTSTSPTSSSLSQSPRALWTGADINVTFLSSLSTTTHGSTHTNAPSLTVQSRTPHSSVDALLTSTRHKVDSPLLAAHSPSASYWVNQLASPHPWLRHTPSCKHSTSSTFPSVSAFPTSPSFPAVPSFPTQGGGHQVARMSTGRHGVYPASFLATMQDVVVQPPKPPSETPKRGPKSILYFFELERPHMGTFEKLYWTTLLSILLYLLYNKIRGRPTKEQLAERARRAAELEAQRQEKLRLVMVGSSFLEGDDLYDGLTPKQIEEYVRESRTKLGIDADENDPYEGMTPREIDAFVRRHGIGA